MEEFGFVCLTFHSYFLNIGVAVIFAQFPINQFRSIAWFNVAIGIATIFIQILMFKGEKKCSRKFVRVYKCPSKVINATFLCTTNTIYQAVSFFITQSFGYIMISILCYRPFRQEYNYLSVIYRM